VGAVAYLLAPLVAALPRAQTDLSFSALLGELAVGLVYGLTLTLLNEMLLFAGQIAGVQFSFSIVNLLDPTSNIQTPLLGDMFQLMGTLVVIGAGLDRILLASMVRSFWAAPLGSYGLAPPTALGIVHAAGGIFLAAVELAAPVLAATMLVELAVALLGKLSPQLQVMNLTVPLKTLTGFVLLAASLALWPRFIEARFAALLDLAQRLIVSSTSSGSGPAPGLATGLGG
jgi:flagellar biosynthetic protein FliR